MTTKILIKTSKKREIIDITDKIESLLGESKITNGLAIIYALHTTCAVIISEYESGLEKDLLFYLQKDGPIGPFSHNHGNSSHASSHLLSALIGQSRSVLVENGRLTLGTWQKVCLLELDGPRDREVAIQIVKNETG